MSDLVLAIAVSTVGASTDERRELFRALVDEHWNAVRHHVNCFVDDDEAEEVVADVFRLGWQKLKPEAPWGRAWFLRTADNILQNRARRAKSRERAMAALEHAVATRPEPDALDVLALRVALVALNKREREVIVLTYWDKLAAGEVAKTLKLSQPVVWKVLSRARAKLQRAMEEGGDHGR